jgi:hypothetical protein
MTQDARAFNWDSIPVKTGATADPAAGANPADVTVPAGKRYLLLAARNQIVCDATVITRYPTLLVLPDGTNEIRRYVGTGSTASQTSNNLFEHGDHGSSGSTGVGDCYVKGFSVPGIEIAAGGIFKLNYTNLQAADNAGVMRYEYKEAPA